MFNKSKNIFRPITNSDIIQVPFIMGGHVFEMFTIRDEALVVNLIVDDNVETDHQFFPPFIRFLADNTRVADFGGVIFASIEFEYFNHEIRSWYDKRSPYQNILRAIGQPNDLIGAIPKSRKLYRD